MVQAEDAARWVIGEQLQRHACSRDPGSFSFAVADHAVGLALKLRRPVDQYLSHNAYRDARKVVAARMRRSRKCKVTLTETERAPALRAPSYTTSIHEGFIVWSELALVWQDAFERLRTAVARLNQLAAACLDHWRDGHEDQETAAILGISLGYVKKLKRVIRDIAAEFLPAAGQS